MIALIKTNVESMSFKTQIDSKHGLVWSLLQFSIIVDDAQKEAKENIKVWT